MVLNYIPKVAWGFKLNDTLSYTTTKQVKIHDRHLGCLYYMWVFLTIFWVIGFQILYGNNHYKLRDVKGTARLTIQQPTLKGCNPNEPDCEDDLTPMTELPYCEVYNGTELADAPKKQECVYADQHELLPGGMLSHQMLIPTRIDQMLESRKCKANATNGFHCKKLWMMERNHKNTYVADIERYTVMIVSSYYRGRISGESSNHQGFYYECRDKETNNIIGTDRCDKNELKIVPIDCLPFLDCGFKATRNPPRASGFLRKRSRVGHQQSISLDANQTSEFTPGPAFSIPSGDIFRMSKLLELAGLNLDGNRNKKGEALRGRGGSIQISIEYANMYPFEGASPEFVGYIYKVKQVPMNEMKTEAYTVSQHDVFPAKRALENRHGIYLHAHVNGSFGFFDWVFLLVMLTTSMALLATGTTLIDALADYLPGLHVKKNKVDDVYNEDDRVEAERANDEGHDVRVDKP